MMKAIVLGATGFLGSHVARALVQEGVDLRILRRNQSQTLALEGVRYEEAIGDLEDRDSLTKAFRGCQVLFHAAGYYPIYSFERERQKDLALNQVRNVLEVAQRVGLQKIVYTSSMSTMGRPKKNQLADENTAYDPLTPGLYYETKYLLEQEALRGVKRGLPVVIVNPTGVFGDYDVKPTSGTLVVKIARREVPFILDAEMNTIDVQDMAAGQIAAMKLGKIGHRYILGGHNTTVGELARLIARLAGVRPPRNIGRIDSFPVGLLVQTAAYASEWVGRYLLHLGKPPIPRVGIDFLRYGMHYNITRARTELGLKTTPLEETFSRALAWFRKHQYL